MGLLKKLFGFSNRCSICHRSMRLLDGFVQTSDLRMRTQGCFQCRACGRLTCFNCSDNRKPCICGAKHWVERTYTL